MRYYRSLLMTLVFYVAGGTSQYLQLQTPDLRQNLGISAALGNNIPRDAGRPLPVLGAASGRLLSTPQALAVNDAFILQGPGSSLTSDAGQGRGNIASESYFPQSFHNVVPSISFGQGVGSGPGLNVGFGQGSGPGPNVGFGQGSGPGPNVGFGQGSGPGPNVGFGQGIGPGSNVGFDLGVGSGPGPNVGFGQGVGSGPAASPGFSRDFNGQNTIFSSGRLSQVNVPRVTLGSTGPALNFVRNVGIPQVRRVDSVFNPTVTQVVTIDRCITVTDQAFNSVAVTLTSFSVQTVTVGTRTVVQTPVDDRVALQTSVFVRPASVTITEVKSDFRIVTETSLRYVTLAHTSYVISQYTYTTTATQVLTYTATMVHTNINTQRTTFTNYRTVTDTVYVNSGYGYRPQ